MDGGRCREEDGRTRCASMRGGRTAGNARPISQSLSVYFHFSKFCGSRYVLSMSQKALGISCVSRELGRSRLLNLKSKGSVFP